MLDKQFAQSTAVAVAGNGSAFASASAGSRGGTAVAVAGPGFAYASASSGGASSPAPTTAVSCRSFNQMPCNARAQGVTLVSSNPSGTCGQANSPCNRRALFVSRNPQYAQRNVNLVIIRSGLDQVNNANAGNGSGPKLEDLMSMVSALMGNSGAAGSNPAGSKPTDTTASPGSGGASDIPGQFANLPKALLDMAKSYAETTANGSKADKQSAQYKEIFQKALLVYIFLHMAEAMMNQNKTADKQV